MTREQAKKFYSSIGITEPTDDQIIAYLNNFHGVIKTEESKIEAWKTTAEKAKELQAQLDAINAEKMSDIEKANAETQKANDQIATLQKQIKAMETRTKLAELGITGEQADKFFSETGEINFDILGQVIADREKQASALKEKEILKDTPNPSGSNGEPSETESEKIAKSIGQKMAESNKVTESVMSHYI